MTILWRHPTAGRNGPQLRAPGDVPKRTGDTAPPRPVAPVSTVAPASSVAPVSIMAMAPIAPMASILLKQNSRDDGRGWRRAGDARTKANGAEPQCADHRSSGRNLLQIHCQTPFPTPYEIATLGSLNSCPAVGDLVQSTTTWWITHSPLHCPNGRRLGREVLVGHQACLGHGGGHTTWTCRLCDATVYGPALNTHCTTLERPATVRIANMAHAQRE